MGLKLRLNMLHRQIIDLWEHVEWCYFLQYPAATITAVEFQATSAIMRLSWEGLSKFSKVYVSLVYFLKYFFYSPRPKSEVYSQSYWSKEEDFRWVLCRSEGPPFSKICQAFFAYLRVNLLLFIAKLILVHSIRLECFLIHWLLFIWSVIHWCFWTWIVSWVSASLFFNQLEIQMIIYCHWQWEFGLRLWQFCSQY